VNANSGTRSAVDPGEFVESELIRTLGFLSLAVNDRRAGNMAAGNRKELSAHRAYQEALYLFRVLRPDICQTGARRLAIRIREIGNAMRGG
jgi:hypothetical protein